MDYYEYKRLHEERLRRVMPEARQAEPVGAPEPPRPAAPRALDAEAQLVARVDNVPAPEPADAEALPSESVESTIGAPVDAIDIPEAAHVPDALKADQPSPSDWDEYDDDLDEEEPHSDNPFAGALMGIKKLGGALRNLGGALKRQVGRSQPVEEETDEDGDEPVAPVAPVAPEASAAPEAQEAVLDDLQAVRIEPQTPVVSAAPSDNAAQDAGLSRRARRAAASRAEAQIDVPAEVKSPYARPDESDEDEEAPQRKRFSLFGSPNRASANQDDDEDEDITPSGGRTPLFGRGAAEDDAAAEEYDEGDAPDEPIGLSEQLAEALDDAPRSRRRRRRAAAVGPEDGDSKEDGPSLSEVDEPTMAFKPLRRREEPEDDQRTRRFSPVRAQSEPEDDEDEAPAPRSARRRGPFGRGAQPVEPEEDDGDDEADDAPPPRRRGPFGRGAQPVEPEEDDEGDEADDAPPPRRRGLFGRGAQPIEPEEDDEDDEDLPVRRYARGAARGGVRVYQDEDDYDDDYEGDYERDGDYDDEEYDEYDEYDAPMSFGKRVLRFFKGLLIVALLLLVAVIALRQLEANGTLSLNWMRRSVGVLVPLDGVFPAPEPTVAPEGLARLESPTVGPLPTPEPTAEVRPPSQGVAIGGDTPAATATAQFVEEEPLESTD
ncbi:hypothetical protein ACH6CV_07395 [Bacillota bacterium Meth-B3]